MQADDAHTAMAGSPAPGPTVVVERPPPGLARGSEPAPGWVLLVLGALALLILAGFYLRKLLLRRKR